MVKEQTAVRIPKSISPHCKPFASQRPVQLRIFTLGLTREALNRSSLTTPVLTMRSESLNGSNWKRSFVSMLCMCSYWLTDETHTGLETRAKARFRMLLENTLAKKLMNYRWLGWDLRVFKSFGFDEIRIPAAECRMPKRLPLELFRDSRSHLNLYYASDVSSLHRDRDASANRCLSLHVGNFS